MKRIQGQFCPWRKKWTCGALAACIGVAMTCLFDPSPAAAEITVAIIAPRGAVIAQKHWGPFADYLSRTLNETVTLKPVVIDELERLMVSHSVDYAICNPVQSISIHTRMGYPYLASLVLPTGSHFGGVILANPKAGISRPQDLKGKRVIGFKTSSAGAFLFQAYYLKKYGVTAPTDFASYSAVNNQDQVIYAVKKGDADAGFVRSGIYDTLIMEGKIAPQDVVIIGRKRGYPQAVTTQLYPEWYMIDVRQDPALAARVKAAAMALPADSDAAHRANITGFTDPVDPGPTLKMMEEMKVPPFNPRATVRSADPERNGALAQPIGYWPRPGTPAP